MSKQSKSLIGADGETAELDEAFFQQARRGRPPLPEEKKKQQVRMLLDPDVIEHFKKGGRGWQTRARTALRKAAGLS